MFASFPGINSLWLIAGYQCDISKLGLEKRYAKLLLQTILTWLQHTIKFM